MTTRDDDVILGVAKLGFPWQTSDSWAARPGTDVAI